MLLCTPTKVATQHGALRRNGCASRHSIMGTKWNIRGVSIMWLYTKCDQSAFEYQQYSANKFHIAQSRNINAWVDFLALFAELLLLIRRLSICYSLTCLAVQLLSWPTAILILAFNYSLQFDIVCSSRLPVHARTMKMRGANNSVGQLLISVANRCAVKSWRCSLRWQCLVRIVSRIWDWWTSVVAFSWELSGGNRCGAYQQRSTTLLSD